MRIRKKDEKKINMRRSQNKGFNVRALVIRRYLVVRKEVVVVEREDGECMAGIMIVYYIARSQEKD